MSRNLFLIPIWKRQAITKICLQNLQEFEHGILCIVSNTEDAEMCYNLNVPFCWYPNDQLGAKWNHGLFVARPMQWDYIVTLGSDDIVKESLFSFYESMGDQDVVITDKIHFIDIPSGRASLLMRARIGAGRRISRKVIEACDYKLWTPEKNKSLDMDSNGRINRAGFACIETKTEPHITGLKSEVNIWGFDHLAPRGYSLNVERALEGILLRTRQRIIDILPEKLQNSLEKPKFVSN